MNTDTNTLNKQPVAVPPKQEQIRKDVQAVRNKKGWSQRKTAGHLNLPASVMNGLINNNYLLTENHMSSIQLKLAELHSLHTGIYTFTQQYKFMQCLAQTTQEEAAFTLVCGNAGLGKTTAARAFYGAHKHTYYTRIDSPDMGWRDLLDKLGTAIGLAHMPYRSKDRYDTIKQGIRQQLEHQPLLIIDEAEWLTSKAVLNLKTLYETFQDRIGIMLVGVHDLRNKLARLSGLNPKTLEFKHPNSETKYYTLWRRMRHFNVPPMSPQDIHDICTKELSIADKDLITTLQKRWAHYGHMTQDLENAQLMARDWKTMTLESLSGLPNTSNPNDTQSVFYNPY